MSAISGHALVGVPLDIPARFLGLGLLFLGLRMWLYVRGAATICMLLLLCTELFEIVAVRGLNKLIPSDSRDLVDLASGVAGIAVAHWLERTRRLVVPTVDRRASRFGRELQTRPTLDGHLAAGRQPHLPGLENPE